MEISGHSLKVPEGMKPYFHICIHVFEYLCGTSKTWAVNIYFPCMSLFTCFWANHDVFHMFWVNMGYEKHVVLQPSC